MAKEFKATIEYRDEYTHGQWRTITAISSICSDAVSMVREHCRNCESRNLRVEAIE